MHLINIRISSLYLDLIDWDDTFHNNFKVFCNSLIYFYSFIMFDCSPFNPDNNLLINIKLKKFIETLHIYF